MLEFCQSKTAKPSIADRLPGVNPSAIRLIEQCLTVDASQRPDIDTLLKNDLFDEYRQDFSAMQPARVKLKTDSFRDNGEYKISSLSKYIIKYTKVIHEDSVLNA